MTISGLPARYHAYQSLMAWQKKPNYYIQDYYDHLDSGVLSPLDLALSREMALGVVRYRALYDVQIRKFLKGKKQADELLLILSLAAHQIFVMQRIPDHAIGQCCVELAQRIRRPHLKSVVNAVVRKLIDLRDPDQQADGPRIAKQHMPHDMAKAYSFPAIFVSDIQRAYKKNWRTLLQQLNTIVPICLRRLPNVEAFTSEHIIKECIVKGHISKEQQQWTWWDNPKAALEKVAEGRATVQDFSQSHVIELAQIQAGERVLDICAAPGGKARAASECTEKVFASDIQVRKIQAMEESLFRLVQNASQPAVAQHSFDVVLADVPCSNSGVFARRPEARWRYSQQSNQSLMLVQQDILRQSATLVKESGRLVYSTCSISPNENHQQIEKFMRENSGWTVVQECTTLPDQWQSGAYAALLQRV